MIVTRADIETKVEELAKLLMQFHGWDKTVDEPNLGYKIVKLSEEIGLIISASAKSVVVSICSKR